MQNEMKRILIDNRGFWEKLLGSELYCNLLKDIHSNVITVVADCIGETEQYIQNLKYCTAVKVPESDSWISDVIFAPFYQIIIDSYLQYSNIDFNVFFMLRNQETMLRQLLYDT